MPTCVIHSVNWALVIARHCAQLIGRLRTALEAETNRGRLPWPMRLRAADGAEVTHPAVTGVYRRNTLISIVSAVAGPS